MDWIIVEIKTSFISTSDKIDSALSPRQEIGGWVVYAVPWID